LQIAPEEVSIRILWLRYRFSREEVTEIRPYRRLFVRGVRICHSKQRAPALVVYWPFSCRRALAEFQQLGYPVSEGDKRIS
jgi:hypothetical protein